MYRRVHARRRARGLGGLTSQPPGRPVSAFALGGLTSQPPGRAVSRFSLGSLGDDPTSPDLTQSTLAQPTVIDPQTAVWQQQTLTNQQAMLTQLRGDRTQKWVQIAVTASIPLFGAIWKMIFGAGRD